MISLLLALACAHSPRDTSALLPGAVTPMGHRGAAGLAFENSMAAFDQALALGVAFELDVRLTRDGALVVLHDPELERLTDGEGLLADLTLDELRALRLGDGSPVPTLGEVLDHVDGRVLVNIEVKAEKGADNRALAEALVEALRASPHRERLLVTSFSPFFLAELAALDPELPRGQLVGTYANSDLKGYEKLLLRRMAFNRGADADLVAAEHVLVDARYLRRQHRRGYAVLAWTVNDPQRMEELIALGVDGVITDRPDLLLEALAD